MSGEVNTPLVSVVIATYNYSSVLKYAIQSVLWQTYHNFELWVIGDGCTDDSEAVVASFADSRVHWVNLPENTGSQAAPNNEGIARASGKYIAYLGHDDLWVPNHLQVLVEKLETSGADLAHTLLMMVWNANQSRSLYGVFPDGYEPPFQVPPGSLMHLRSMVDDIGLWQDFRQVRIPFDIEFVSRAVLKGKRIVCVDELTIFKFPSGVRKNVYVEKPSFEQAAYAERIQHERDFLYHELRAAVLEPLAVRRALEVKIAYPSTLKPGEIIDGYRAMRGLAPKPATGSEVPSLFDDFMSLVAFNPQDDITPVSTREFLHQQHTLPKNGVLIGSGWHGLEHDGAGQSFRWLGEAADILLTNLDPQAWQLSLKVWLGYANDGQPVTLALVNDRQEMIEQVSIAGAQQVTFRFTAPESGTAVYTLRVQGSQNKPLPNDPRILNIGVGSLSLEAAP